jgi:hypothetical protein
MKYDYERIFKEAKIAEDTAPSKKNKERGYIIKFFVQAIICIAVIGSIIIVKYTSPNTFISVSSILSGLYEDNITLSDLNELIDETISKNDALAAFFNINPGGGK